MKLLTKTVIEKLSKSLTDTKIAVLSPTNVVLLKPGSVILFKTNMGNYGKLELGEVTDIPNNYYLNFSFVVYKSDGTVLNTEIIKMGGSFSLDLDAGKLINDTTSDFEWAAPVDDNFYINPLNGAKFYLYSKK